MKVGRSELKRRASDILRKGLTDALLHLIIDSLWRDADEIVRIVNVSINNSFISNSNITNNSTTNIYNTIRSIVNQQAENNHESYLIENTVANTVTQESSWSVQPYDQQVGEFKAVVMIRNKATDTIITLMSLLSFDYSEVPSVVLQNDLLTGSATLTVSVSAGSKLQAVVTGMAGDDKRIHFCFERCVMGMRTSDMEASGLLELNGTANLVLAQMVDIEAGGLLELNGNATLDEAFDLQASGLLEFNGTATPILAELTNITAAGTLHLNGTADLDELPVSEIDNGLLYNWPAATDSRNIAAPGYHLPTLSEYNDLITYLGGNSVAGEKLKEAGFIHWNSPNTGATNEVGFNGRGSGYKADTIGFNGLKTIGMFWTATTYSGNWKNNITIRHDLSSVSTYNDPAGSANYKTGASIRLVKDSTSLTHGQTGTYLGNNGKLYRTICINGKEWLADNLAETEFGNGDPIPEVTNNAEWAALTTGAFCAYNYDWNNV